MAGVDDLAIRPWAGEPDLPGIDRDGWQAPYCVVAEVDGKIVGYGSMRRWTEADGTRLYLLLGRVSPAWRGHGIGRELLRRQEERAVAAAEAEGTTGTAVLGANAEPDEDAARRLLCRGRTGSTWRTCGDGRPTRGCGAWCGTATRWPAWRSPS